MIYLNTLCHISFVKACNVILRYNEGMYSIIAWVDFVSAGMVRKLDS